jgi:S-adenosylmethionine:diacylglycerol 3-amino-3-carboxypropyl transferase
MQVRSLPARSALADDAAASAPRDALTIFARRIVRERNLYGALAFAETAESLRLCREALAPGPKDRVAGITSSGDVLLALAARGAEVVGFDHNPAQTALAELKRAAMRRLDVASYRRLMGIDPWEPGERRRWFEALVPELPAAAARALAAGSLIEAGPLNRGMTYLIIRALTGLLARLVPAASMDLFLGRSGSDEERRSELQATLQRPLARRVLAPFLRAQARRLKWLFFPHTICRVSDRPDQMIADFFRTFEPLFVAGARANPVLSRAATDRLHPEWTEELYTAAHFAAAGAQRVRFETASITAGLARLPDRWATKIYLSNAPDYLTEGQLAALIGELRRVAAPGATVLAFSLCDLDRLGDALGAPLEAEAHRRLVELDNVHLYPSIIVRSVEGR